MTRTRGIENTRKKCIPSISKIQNIFFVEMKHKTTQQQSIKKKFTSNNIQKNTLGEIGEQHRQREIKYVLNIFI